MRGPSNWRDKSYRVGEAAKSETRASVIASTSAVDGVGCRQTLNRHSHGAASVCKAYWRSARHCGDASSASASART